MKEKISLFHLTGNSKYSYHGHREYVDLFHFLLFELQVVTIKAIPLISLFIVIGIILLSGQAALGYDCENGIHCIAIHHWNWNRPSNDLKAAVYPDAEPLESLIRANYDSWNSISSNIEVTALTTSSVDTWCDIRFHAVPMTGTTLGNCLIYTYSKEGALIKQCLNSFEGNIDVAIILLDNKKNGGLMSRDNNYQVKVLRQELGRAFGLQYVTKKTCENYPAIMRQGWHGYYEIQEHDINVFRGKWGPKTNEN